MWDHPSLPAAIEHVLRVKGMPASNFNLSGLLVYLCMSISMKLLQQPDVICAISIEAAQAVQSRSPGPEDMHGVGT